MAVSKDSSPAMTIDRSAAALAAIAVAPVDLSPAVRHTIFLYLGILIVLATFGAPWIGLIDIPISFFLKNRLHLTASRGRQFPAGGGHSALFVLRVRVHPRHAGIRSG